MTRLTEERERALTEWICKNAARMKTDEVGFRDGWNARDAEVDALRAEPTKAELIIAYHQNEAIKALRAEVERIRTISGDQSATIDRLEDRADAADARVVKLEDAMRQILVGKIRADNEHPMGEWFSMAGRFMNIARAALEETKS